jgi:endonuclease-3
MVMTSQKPRHSRQIADILIATYPETVPLLHFQHSFELLIAVILSAQCTDEQVNRISPILFARWPDPLSLSKAPLGEIEKVIHSTGFFRTKAAHIRATSEMLVQRFKGHVPESIDLLIQLPGVGRKTANLVASACFGVPGLIIDTHVSRVCLRLGFSKDRNPLKIEMILKKMYASERWTPLSHALNRHGKFTCTARKPECRRCPIKRYCPSAISF